MNVHKHEYNNLRINIQIDVYSHKLCYIFVHYYFKK